MSTTRTAADPAVQVDPARAIAHGLTRPGRGRQRAWTEVVAFVVVWVAGGYVLRIDANGYLLLGVPLTLAFQGLVRRRPVRELCAAGTDRLRPR